MRLGRCCFEHDTCDTRLSLLWLNCEVNIIEPLLSRRRRTRIKSIGLTRVHVPREMLLMYIIFCTVCDFSLGNQGELPTILLWRALRRQIEWYPIGREYGTPPSSFPAGCVTGKTFIRTHTWFVIVFRTSRRRQRSYRGAYPRSHLHARYTIFVIIIYYLPIVSFVDYTIDYGIDYSIINVYTIAMNRGNKRCEERRRRISQTILCDREHATTTPTVADKIEYL